MWITDPDDPRLKTVLEKACEVCKAKRRVLCHNTITPGEPIPGRIVHLARSTASDAGGRVRKGSVGDE